MQTPKFHQVLCFSLLGLAIYSVKSQEFRASRHSLKETVTSKLCQYSLKNICSKKHILFLMSWQILINVSLIWPFKYFSSFYAIEFSEKPFIAIFVFIYHHPLKNILQLNDRQILKNECNCQNAKHQFLLFFQTNIKDTKFFSTNLNSAKAIFLC